MRIARAGRGGAGVGLSANSGVRFWSCGWTSVVSCIRGYNSVLQLRGIEALLQPFTGNETVPEGSLRRPLTPPNPKVVALQRNSSFNLMFLSTQINSVRTSWTSFQGTGRFDPISTQKYEQHTGQTHVHPTKPRRNVALSSPSSVT